MPPYNVKIDVFEGPFDLLLHLVRMHEMDIYDIRIAEIAKAYLDYIREMEKLDLDVAGDFLVMAATLVNIKSRTLMPSDEPEEEEEAEEEIDDQYGSIRDARELMQRLIEYRQFKEISVELNQREDEELKRFYRNQVLPRIADEEEPRQLREDISLLFSAFARVLAYTEGRPTHHVTEEEFSVEEKIEYISRRIAAERRVRLFDLFEKCVCKQEAITLFLAILETCRLRKARVRQDANYEDIYIIHADEPLEDDDE